MNISQYKKILRVTKQQVRMVAFSLSRLDEVRNGILEKQQRVQTKIQMTQQQFQQQFQTPTVGQLQSNKQSICIHQMSVAHWERERLQAQLKDLSTEYAQNKSERLNVLHNYQRLHSRQLALEKLVERSQQNSDMQAQQREDIELHELSAQRQFETFHPVLF